MRYHAKLAIHIMRLKQSNNKIKIFIKINAKKLEIQRIKIKL